MAPLFIFCYHKMNQARVTTSTRIKEIPLLYLSNQIGLIWKNLYYFRWVAFAGRWYVKCNIFSMLLLHSNILVSIHSCNILNQCNIPFRTQYHVVASYREWILPRVSLYLFRLLKLTTPESQRNGGVLINGGMKNRKIIYL